ncbi:hypothetical protein [Plantactinospora endophytica]|uniref:SnoaL-like domain-containing protein n=1 Tax=Plantactinospora endophytica TaxID=673535 RepID=A0ABQ4EE46_9ACTN|nr:hypothetical protein [Plantactinospora endophytica]GIG92985.1 hypothetical protein Pen02_79210 [Plantactinospora endophytica]
MASFRDNLAENVTLEGAVMNGVLTGRDAVLAQLAVVNEFYRDRVDIARFDQGEYVVEQYSATVAGRPVQAIALMHRDGDGRFDRVVVNHWPLSATLTFSRLLAESPIGQAEDPARFYRPDGQSYQDLLDYTDRQPAR